MLAMAMAMLICRMKRFTDELSAHSASGQLEALEVVPLVSVPFARVIQVMDEIICKICGDAREEIPAVTKNKKLPAYFCLQCDGNTKRDAKVDSKSLEDDSGPH